MIQSLFIKNYALIDHIEIQFKKGFCTVTGETGAGKSIILGALSLILGDRFEHHLLIDKSKKCVVEGSFSVPENLKDVFIKSDLDFEPNTIIHREISPTGKSRTFINDTPVTLTTLKEISLKLVDIHSQYHSLQLKEQSFQLNLVDSYAANNQIYTEYKKYFSEYKKLKKYFDDLKQQAKEYKANLDYFQFQYNQLESALLNPDEQETLEAELNELTHAEDIKSTLFHAHKTIEDDENSINDRLKTIIQNLEKTVDFYPNATTLLERLTSVHIELKDISDEAYSDYEHLDFDQSKIDEITTRLNLIYELQKKFHTSNIQELLVLKEDFHQKISSAESFENQIIEAQIKLETTYNKLEKSAEILHRSRKNVSDKLAKELMSYLRQLGMQDANIIIEITPSEDFNKSGKDMVKILFAANKNVQAQKISKVASGGELSRIMLAIKAIISKTKQLPTMIFDEIDMGVSGEIADKMSVIMKEISKINQVIAITHLPQIASKGDNHYKVYKETTKNKTFTKIRILNNNERINEIAGMLSGNKITDAAIDNARALLN